MDSWSMYRFTLSRALKDTPALVAVVTIALARRARFVVRLIDKTARIFYPFTVRMEPGTAFYLTIDGENRFGSVSSQMSDNCESAARCRLQFSR